MKVLVDTCIWSEALRKKQGQPVVVAQLSTLIQDDRAILLGLVRQELLSGIRNKRVFDRIERQLNPFPDIPLTKEDYITAARCANACRAKGVQGSAIDFLITAIALNYGYSIYTTDHDFNNYQSVLKDLQLH